MRKCSSHRNQCRSGPRYNASKALQRQEKSTTQYLKRYSQLTNQDSTEIYGFHGTSEDAIKVISCCDCILTLLRQFYLTDLMYLIKFTMRTAKVRILPGTQM